jgi:hypothetical protein
MGRATATSLFADRPAPTTPWFGLGQVRMIEVTIEIDLSTLYGDLAKIARLEDQ